LYQQSATAFLHQRSQLFIKTIFCLDRVELAANMSLPRRGASTLLSFRFSQISLSLFLLCQRGGLCAVLLVLRPAFSGQLCRFRRKERLPEALNAKFSHKCKTCGGEEHLLAHWSAIGNVGHSDVAIRFARSDLQENITGGCGREEG
jgi:hypothetical protein